MLHELIFVLSGFPSNIFIPYPPAPEKSITFAIAHDVPSLHPAERESLNRLGQLGWFYAELVHFYNDQNNYNKTTTSAHSSAYVQALVTSLNTTLDDYRRDILTMERQILNKDYDAGEGVVPTSLLTSSLGQWELLLPALVQFTQRLSERLSSGLLLLDFVLDEARTGHDAYRRVMETMAARLYDVLYRQLTAWMVYGHVANEFFVTSTTTQQQQQSQQNNNNKHSVGWQRYGLVKERIPTRIPLGLAESILFVGKAVATVKDPPDTMKRENLKLLVELQQRQLTLDYVVHHMRKTTAEWLFSQVLIGDHALARYFISFRKVFMLGYGDMTTNFIEACTQWRHRATLSKRSISSAEKIFRHQEFNALLAKASVGTEAEDQLDGYSVKILEPPQEQEGSSSHGFSDLLLMDVACTLRYSLEWPIDLFLSQSVMQQYSKIWSFLIGLKNVQICLCESFLRTHLHSIWRLRSHMLYWINALWAHVQTNVIDVHHQSLMEIVSLSSDNNHHHHDSMKSKKRWTYHNNSLVGHALHTTLHPTTTHDTTTPSRSSLDFEELQNIHMDYLRHVTRGCLLSSSDCIKCIQRILRACLDFCTFIQQVNEEQEAWRGTKRRKMAKTAAEIVREWTRGLEQETAMATTGDQVDAMEKEFIAMTDQFFDLLTNASQEIKVSGNIDMLLMQLDYNKWYSGDRSMRIL
ncbi:gamma-tubulin complex component protein [Phascolomyces articulosus]|uniref:Spindle pole body component n=1 Tax=Phascolomyces articulosus TaxID=60185 RepID=A0AAD5K636_9FUNG|nr:gamma-tubulin complex component protein [Phascolomyces articulosus]